MRKYALPPATALQAFEAAARLGSFRSAGEELGRIPSAISHQVKELEERLGTALFRRDGRRKILTEDGALYAAAIARGFGEIARAGEVLAEKRRTPVVRVSVAPAFASLALLPRIDLFEALNPGFTLKLEVETKSADLFADPIDAVIRIGDGNWPGLHSERLFNSRLLPMASPSLWEAHPDLREPHQLTQLLLIEFSLAPTLWDDWLTAFVPEPPTHRRTVSCDTLVSVLQSAEAGVGVIIGAIPLLAPMLLSGRLVAPWPDKSMPTEADYYLVCRPAEMHSPRIRSVREWVKKIVAELAEASEQLTK